MVEQLSSSYRAYVALILAEQGKGELVFSHLNDVFAGVNQEALAEKLIETGQTDILAEYLHYFKKQSLLDIHIADALVQDGYEDEVMSMPDIFSCSLYELQCVVTYGLDEYMRREKRRVLSFIKKALRNLPAEKIIPEIELLNPSYRADIALALAEQGNGALVFSHLNDVFADVNQQDLARKLIETRQTDMLTEHFYCFKKQSLGIYIAYALIRAGHREEEVMEYA